MPPSTAAGAFKSPVPRAAPISVDIPRIDAHSSLAPWGLRSDGQLDVVDVTRPLQAGWYCDKPQLANPVINCKSGVLPGQIGPALIAGHVDGSPVKGVHQKGIFYRLHELEAGDTVSVGLADGTQLTFAVYRVLKSAKTQFPASVTAGGDTVAPELRVITCGGPFVGGEMGYADNVIVFATLIPNVPT